LKYGLVFLLSFKALSAEEGPSVNEDCSTFDGCSAGALGKEKGPLLPRWSVLFFLSKSNDVLLHKNKLRLFHHFNFGSFT
jgi:hypothetical protein